MIVRGREEKRTEKEEDSRQVIHVADASFQRTEVERLAWEGFWEHHCGFFSLDLCTNFVKLCTGPLISFLTHTQK